MAMLMSVRDLVCSRGGIPVLEGVSFDLSAGQVLILRGANGSGKTTLLRVLADLAPPMNGSIDVDRETIIYGGHADGVKGTLTVRENLSFWASLYRGSGVDRAMAAMDLSPLADRPAQNLSAGQRRRLGLARLTVTERKIWLLDEPTASLDDASVATFASLVREHIGTGGAAVIATHTPLGIEGSTLETSDHRARSSGTSDPFGEAFV